MGFLIWLEGTALASWVSTSAVGYPMMIACHAIGMAIMVGLALLLDCRMLGAFAEIPYAGLQRFVGIAWAGFGLNFLSGVALFATQATQYVTNTVFLLKIGLVALGMIFVGIVQTAMVRDAAQWRAAASPGIRCVAVASIVVWVGAIVTGRLIAYL